MTRTERRQRNREETGKLQGAGNPWRLRDGLKRGKGKRERDGGDQNHHRTVKIAN